MPERIPRPDTAPRGRHIVIAFNRIAGAGGREARVDHLTRSFRSAGFEATICPSEESLVELVARLSAEQNLGGVVAAGGDGTVSWVANRVPADTPLACFPLGTENLLARYLEHGSDPGSLVRLFEEGVPTSIDAGQANGRLFSLMAGCGFDAEVVEQLHRTRRGNIRHWSYIKPLVDTLRTYAYPSLSVRITGPSGAEETIECRWAFVVNIPRYAFGLQLDRQASPLDGLLNVVTFRDGSLWCGLNYLASIVWGTHALRSDVCVRPARAVRVDAAAACRYQLDGDPGGDLPVEIGCLPGRLRILVSPQWLERHSILPVAPLK
jgi:diacylglycerol kinase family enzyme